MPDLLLDLTSPLPSFTESEIRAWAAGKQIFISSTMADLQPERAQAAKTVRDMGANPRFFEGFSTPSDPAGVYVPEVNRADIVLLLLGRRYGDPLPNMGSRSATHVEYDAAVEALKPILVYRKEAEDLDREPQLEAFMRQLDPERVAARFHDVAQLETLIREGLEKRAQADSIEWVKLGQAVFPATSWQQLGSNIQIHTATRDPHIIAHLQNLAARQFGSREILIVGTDVLQASRISLREEGRGRYQREYLLDVEIERDQFGTPRPFKRHLYTQFGSMNGQSSQEIIRSYIRAMLFNEPMPDPMRLSYSRREPERPAFYLPELYAQLKDHQRVDELFPSLGRVYLVDRLVRGTGDEGGIAEKIYRLELSPVYGGRVHIRLEYAAGSQYGSSTIDRVEGFIVLEEPRVVAPIRDWA